MNMSKVNELIKNQNETSENALSIVRDIVKNYTKDLDNLMTDITNDVINNKDVDDRTLESYFLELTNALYFITPYCEGLGMNDDIGKIENKLAYNEAYLENQVTALSEKKKVTISDNEIYAENSTNENQLVSYIYSRAYKMVKAKIDSANEMIKTLSKIISKRMNDASFDNKNFLPDNNQDVFNGGF